MYNKIKGQGITDADIREALITALGEQNKEYEVEISKMEQQKSRNNEADAFNAELGALPSTDNTEKVMRYEVFIQKFIAQNIILLRNLQGV